MLTQCPEFFTMLHTPGFYSFLQVYFYEVYMLPFALQKLIMELRSGTKGISIMQSKLSFCRELESELGIQSSRYSEDIYDLWYNLSFLKRQLKDFPEIYKIAKSWDYLDIPGTSEEITKMYNRVILSNIELFYDVFGLSNSDPQYVTRVLEQKKKSIRSTLLDNYKSWGHL